MAPADVLFVDKSAISKAKDKDKYTDLVEIEQGLGWQTGVLGFHSPFLHRTFDL